LADGIIRQTRTMFFSDSDGNPYVLSKKSAQVHNGRDGGWIYLQQQVTAEKDDTRRGLSLFWHLAMNDRGTATMDYQMQAGAIYKDLFANRPMDYVGFGISKMHVNSKVAERARLLNERKGITDDDDPSWTPIRTAEYAAELHYSFAITPWLTFRPNVQLLINLGGVKEVKDAWVLESQFIIKM
jgi:porin